MKKCETYPFNCCSDSIGAGAGFFQENSSETPVSLYLLLCDVAAILSGIVEEKNRNSNRVDGQLYSEAGPVAGTCIAEMPELEEMYQDFQQDHINLIGVGADSGEGEEQLELAKKILAEKGVTYQNIVPDPENDFYKKFIGEIAGYPTTYVVDNEGNIIGAPIIGNVKEQMVPCKTESNRHGMVKDK